MYTIRSLSVPHYRIHKLKSTTCSRTQHHRNTPHQSNSTQLGTTSTLTPYTWHTPLYMASTNSRSSGSTRQHRSDTSRRFYIGRSWGWLDMADMWLSQYRDTSLLGRYTPLPPTKTPPDNSSTMLDYTSHTQPHTPANTAPTATSCTP